MGGGTGGSTRAQQRQGACPGSKVARRPTQKSAAGDGKASAKPRSLPTGVIAGTFAADKDYEKAYDYAAAGKKIEEYGKRTTAQQKRWAESHSKNEAIATAEHHACLAGRLSWLLHPVPDSAGNGENEEAGPSALSWFGDVPRANVCCYGLRCAS